MKMYRPIKQWNEWVKNIAMAFLIYAPIVLGVYLTSADGRAQIERIAKSKLIQTLTSKDEKCRIVKHERSINVIETKFPYNSRRVWHDRGADGNLDAISSTYVCGRGYASQVLQKGDKGFEFAEKEYKEKIFPYLNTGTSLKNEQ